MTTQRFFCLLFASAIGFILFTPQPAIAGMVMFQDMTFNDPDWVASVWADTSAPPATFTAMQVIAGGNPTDYRETTHNYGAGLGGAILVEHRNLNFNWTPSNNVFVTDIDFQYDLKYFSSATLPGGAVGYGLNIYQGGKLYRYSPQDNILASSWTNFSHLVVPLSSFWEIAPGSGTANFLSNPVGNQAMSFGYMSANSANQTSTKVSGIDNLKITLWTVPEPGSAALTMTGFLGGVGSVFRRRRV